MKLSKIKDAAVVADVYKVKKFNRIIPAGITSRVGRSSLVLQQNSPTILFGLGVIGFGATVVLACKATLRVDEVIDEHELMAAEFEKTRDNRPDDYSDKDLKHDIAVLRVRTGFALFKLYAPAISVGVLSVAALTGSHNILSKRNAGLTAAYAATEKAFNDYRERVREDQGEQKDREYMHGVEERTIVEETPDGKKKRKVRGFKSASQYAVVFEEGATSNWEPQPEYNIMLLRTVQNHLNDQLHANGFVLLNDAYEALGFPRTEAGCVVGWLKDSAENGTGDGNIDFGVFSDHNRDQFLEYVTGHNGAILIDFNVDGVIHKNIDKIGNKKRGLR